MCYQFHFVNLCYQFRSFITNLEKSKIVLDLNVYGKYKDTVANSILRSTSWL